MIRWLVNKLIENKRPDISGPGFFSWRPFRLPIIAVSLRYDDDLRRPGGVLPCVPMSFRFYVTEGEVIVHTSGDHRNDPRWMHSYADAEGEEIAVYAVKAGESFRVHAGDPLLLELNIPSPVIQREIHYPTWMVPGEIKSSSKQPAKMIVLRG